MRRFLLVLLALLLLCGAALAHSGRTDSSGGHWDHSTGTYHYHNGGGSSSGSKSSSSSSSSGVSSGKPSKLVTTGSVNMREGASTSYDIITTLPEGTVVSYGGKVSGNWYYVKYGLQYGWIHQNYARVTSWESSGGSSNLYIPSISNVFSSTSSEEKEPALMRTNAYTILRSEADSTSKAIAMILSGKTLTYAGKTSGEWRYVRYGTTYGWIQDKHLDTITMRGKTEPLNIRKGYTPSMGMLFLVFCVGLIIGILSVIFFAKRKLSKNEAYTKREIDAVKRSVEYEINRVTEKYESEANARQKLQLHLLQSKRAIEALKIAATPDLSEGIVYISTTLDENGKYHHLKTCKHMEFSVLVSKKSAIALGYTPCDCTNQPAPEHDAIVYITERNRFNFYGDSAVYHTGSCYHVLKSKTTWQRLSTIDHTRFYPCSLCKPPKENPTIWL